MAKQEELVLVFPDRTSPDFGEIRGLEAAKRAMLIALSGLHSVALIGPHGNGKTLLIKSAQKVAKGLSMEVEKFHELTTADLKKFLDNEDSDAGDDMEPLVRAHIHVEVSPLSFRDLTGRSKGTDSATIERKLKDVAIWRDDKMDPRRMERLRHGLDMSLSEDVLLLGKQAYEEMGMTPRSFHIAVRVARTIADLEEFEKIQAVHFAEAIQYRLLDRR